MSENSKVEPVALITGSGRPRVGKVIARDLAQHGYRIAVHYHSSADEARETVDQLQQAGTSAYAFQADVTVVDQVDRMISEVIDRFGRLDALVTTSSIWSSTNLEETTKEDLHRHFDVNALGTLYAARAAGRVMVEQKEGGAIVTIGDWAIERPYIDHAAYLISKGAIPTLTRLLAVELGHRNPRVRVNCIHPGPVMFPPDSNPEEQQALIESTLVKNADCPEMVALAVRLLIQNSFVTGTCLPVDGGRTIFSPDSLKRR